MLDALRALLLPKLFTARARAVSSFGAMSVRSSSSIQYLDQVARQPFAR